MSGTPVAEGVANINWRIWATMGVGSLVCLGFAFSGGKTTLPALIVAVLLGVPTLLAFLGRRRFRAWPDRLEVSSTLRSRTLLYADSRHVITLYSSDLSPVDPGAVTTSSQIDALRIVDDNGRKWTVPGSGSLRPVRETVAQEAVAAAVAAAELDVASGGTYRDPDGFSGLDSTHLHGRRVGLVVKKASASLSEVERVSPDGVVVPRGEGKPFNVGAADVVLMAMLRSRGLVSS